MVKSFDHMWLSHCRAGPDAANNAFSVNCVGLRRARSRILWDFPENPAFGGYPRTVAEVWFGGGGVRRKVVPDGAIARVCARARRAIPSILPRGLGPGSRPL